MKKKREKDLWQDDDFIDISSRSGTPAPARPPRQAPAEGERKRRPPPPRGEGTGRRKAPPPGESPPRKRRQPPSGAGEPRSIRDYDGFEEYGPPRKRSSGGPESRRNPTPPRKPRERGRSPQNKTARRLIVAAAVLAMAAVTALLCIFLLFKVSEIQVTGDRVYENSEILNLCGYKAGDNLFFVSTGDKEKLLKEKLPYIENVKILRHLPGTLEIQITGAQVVSCISSGGSWLYLSGGEKILEKKGEPKAGAMQVEGLAPLDTEPGQSLRLEDENLLAAYSAILDKLVELEVAGKFTKLDLSDLYDIRLWYEDRVEFKLGSTAELSYKVEFGCSLVSDPEKIDAKARGTLDLSYADVKRASFSASAGASSVPPAGSSSLPDGSEPSSSEGRGGEIPDAPYTGGPEDNGLEDGGSDGGYTDEAGGDETGAWDETDGSWDDPGENDVWMDEGGETGEDGWNFTGGEE